LGIFHPEEELGAKSGSGNGGSDYGPTDRCGDGIAEAVTECEVDEERDEIGESFEDDVRVYEVVADVDVDREACEMGLESDGELYLGQGSPAGRDGSTAPARQGAGVS
jgi:hypothetical protein